MAPFLQELSLVAVMTYNHCDRYQQVLVTE